MTSTVRGPSTPGRALAWVAALGPPAYIVLTVVLGASWAGYDPVRDTQSELGAVDAPTSLAMNAGFAGLGVAILCFAGASALLLGPPSRWVVVGLSAVAGLGMVAVAFAPCDPGCVDVTASGRLHGLLSAPGAIGLPMAAVASAWVLGRDPRFTRGWSVGSLLVGLVTLASGPVVAAGVVADANGLLQRAGMWPALLWMSAVAGRLATTTMDR